MNLLKDLLERANRWCFAYLIKTGLVLFCSDSPDMSGANQAALESAQLSRDQLDWAKQIYAESAPDRAAATERANAVSDAQLASMKMADAQSIDQANYQKNTFRPLEQKIASDAIGFDTPQRREQEAGQAMADVGSQADIARQTAMREQEARGVDPSSGNTAIALSRSAIGQAAAKAAAGNAARKQVETLGAAKLADAANLGRGIASSQATQAGLALNAGNSSSGNAITALQPNAQAGAQVQNAYGSAAQNMGSVSSNLANIAKAGQTDDSALWGTVGKVAGIAAMSDKNQKKDRKPVKGEVALSMARKMPVESWRYKNGSPANDGGKKHIGPMAQSVKAAAGDAVAPGGKVIDLVSMNGITLAAVKALDKKVTRLEKSRT